MVVLYCVHDIVQLAPCAQTLAALPPWAAAELAARPFAVVRRRGMRGGKIPVGVRGAARGQRAAAWVLPAEVRGVTPPRQLATEKRWHESRLADGVFARTLEQMDVLAGGLGLAWGPGGSVGYELATGCAAVHPGSDLDCVVYCDAPLPAAQAQTLWQASLAWPVRADILLETPFGAVALAEYAAGGKTLLLRTENGPLLVADPWAPPLPEPEPAGKL